MIYEDYLQDCNALDVRYQFTNISKERTYGRESMKVNFRRYSPKDSQSLS